MHNPLIENEKIKIKNLFVFLKKILEKYLRILIIIIFAYSLYYVFLKPTYYSANLSFYTDYEESNNVSSISLLQSISNGGSSNLSFAISNYLSSDKFLESIVLKDYEINGNQKKLIDIFNNSKSFNPLNLFQSSRYIPNLTDREIAIVKSKKLLKSQISLFEDRKTGLYKISITSSANPVLLEQIANAIYKSIIDFSAEVSSIKASEKVSFVESRLKEINLKLEESESDMVVFLEQNKNLQSPSLILKKDRIQRNINLYNQLYLSLSDQLELAKIDEKDNTSSLFLLDFPHISPYKSGKSYFQRIIMIFSFMFFTFITFEMIVNRNYLFKK